MHAIRVHVHPAVRMFFFAAFLGENVRVYRFATVRAVPDWGIGTSVIHVWPPIPSHCDTLRSNGHVGLRRAKMETVSEVLQLPVVIEGRRPFSRESEVLEKLDFLLGRIAAEGRILQECGEPRLFV